MLRGWPYLILVCVLIRPLPTFAGPDRSISCTGPGSVEWICFKLGFWASQRWQFTFLGLGKLLYVDLMSELNLACGILNIMSQVEALLVTASQVVQLPCCCASLPPCGSLLHRPATLHRWISQLKHEPNFSCLWLRWIDFSGSWSVYFFKKGHVGEVQSATVEVTLHSFSCCIRH